jgi:hypothetical protein
MARYRFVIQYFRTNAHALTAYSGNTVCIEVDL